MAKEILSTPKVRKSHQHPGLATSTDNDIRIVKLPVKKDPPVSETSDPFSNWKMPPQQDGYLKSTHKDCL